MAKRSDSGCGLVLSIAIVLFFVSRCSGSPNSPTSPSRVAGIDGVSQSPAQASLYAIRAAACRASPARRARIVTRLGRSDRIVVEQAEGTWSRVRTIEGSCWVSSGALSAVAPERDPEPVAPLMASGPLTPRRSQRAEGSFQCGSKRVCRQMDSCAEANFYLNQCGLTRLDGDGDGIPCESIC